MKKDIIIAIIIGFCIGALVAVIVLSAPMVFNRKEQDQKITAQTEESSVPTAVQELATELSLDITNPKNESIEKSPNINITGKSAGKMLIVLENEDGFNTKEASDDGTFSFDHKLQEGFNEVLITAYSQTGDSVTRKINVFHTPEKL